MNDVEKKQSVKRPKQRNSFGKFMAYLGKNLWSSIKANWIAIVIVTLACVASGVCYSFGLNGWYMKVLYFITGQNAPTDGGNVVGNVGSFFSKMFLITAVLNFVVPMLKKLFSKKNRKPKTAVVEKKAKPVKPKGESMIAKIAQAGFQQIGLIICSFGVAVALYMFLSVDGSLKNSFSAILTALSLASILLTRANSIITALSKLFKMNTINNAPIFSCIAGLTMGLTFGYFINLLSPSVNTTYKTALAIFLFGIFIIVVVKVVNKITYVSKLLKNFCMLLLALSIALSPLSYPLMVMNNAYALEVSVEDDTQAQLVCRYLNNDNKPTSITIEAPGKDNAGKDYPWMSNEVTISREEDAPPQDTTIINVSNKTADSTLFLFFSVDKKVDFSVTLSYFKPTRSTGMLYGTYNARCFNAVTFGQIGSEDSWSGNCTGNIIPIIVEGKQEFALELIFDGFDDSMSKIDSSRTKHSLFQTLFLQGNTADKLIMPITDIEVNYDEDFDFVAAALGRIPNKLSGDDVSINDGVVTIHNVDTSQAYALFDSEGNMVGNFIKPSPNDASVEFPRLMVNGLYRAKPGCYDYNDTLYWSSDGVLIDASNVSKLVDITTNNITVDKGKIKINSPTIGQEYAVLDVNKTPIDTWARAVNGDNLEVNTVNNVGTYYVQTRGVGNTGEYDHYGVAHSITINDTPTPTSVIATDITIEGNKITVNNVKSNQQYGLFDSNNTLLGEWQQQAQSPSLLFTVTSAGTYLLQVRSQDFAGNWTKQGTALSITITEPTPTSVVANDVTIEHNKITVNNINSDQQYALFDSNGAIVGDWVSPTATATQLEFTCPQAGDYTIKTRAKNFNQEWGVASVGTYLTVTEQKDPVRKAVEEISVTVAAVVCSAAAAAGLSATASTAMSTATSVVTSTLTSTATTTVTSSATTVMASTTSATASTSASGGLGNIVSLGQTVMSGGGKQAIKGISINVTRSLDKKRRLAKAEMDEASARLSTALVARQFGDIEKADKRYSLAVFGYRKYYPIVGITHKGARVLEAITSKRLAVGVDEQTSKILSSTKDGRLAVTCCDSVWLVKRNNAMMASAEMMGALCSRGKTAEVDDIFAGFSQEVVDKQKVMEAKAQAKAKHIKQAKQEQKLAQQSNQCAEDTPAQEIVNDEPNTNVMLEGADTQDNNAPMDNAPQSTENEQVEQQAVKPRRKGRK